MGFRGWTTTTFTGKTKTVNQMIILFSGHRNVTTTFALLQEINQKYPNAVWLHGGAADGFDSIVHSFIEWQDLIESVKRPNYKRFPSRPKYAPLFRDEQMAIACDRAVVAYDGRTSGGTFYTLEILKKLGKPFENIKFTYIEGVD